MELREAERVAELASYDIMGTPKEPEFDRITRLARQLTAADISVLTFLDDRNQFVKAIEGADMPVLGPRTKSICDRVVRTGATVSIADLWQDTQDVCRTVAGDLGMSSYTGVPITTPGGHVLGAVATLASEKRTLSEPQVSALHDLSQIVMREMAIRKIALRSEEGAGHREEVAGETLGSITRNHLNVLRSLNDGVIAVRRNGTVNFVNPAAERILARPASSMLGLPFFEAVRNGGRSEDCQVSASLKDGMERMVRKDKFRAGSETSIAVEYISSPLIVESAVFGAVVVFRMQNDASVSNGVELRNALREVKRLKEQLLRLDKEHQAARSKVGSSCRDPVSGGPQDFEELIGQIRDIEADQIMRAMKSTGDVIDGPEGAAALLDITPGALRLKLRTAERQRRDNTASRIERWLV